MKNNSYTFGRRRALGSSGALHEWVEDRNGAIGVSVCVCDVVMWCVVTRV